MIHDGTNVTVVEESAVATGDMLGSLMEQLGSMLNLSHNGLVRELRQLQPR